MNTLLLLLGVGAVVLAASNWTTCSSAHYLVDANGNRVAEGVPCLGCRIVATTRRPDPFCLLNPFPGGM
jgi:hypothetical protein